MVRMYCVWLWCDLFCAKLCWSINHDISKNVSFTPWVIFAQMVWVPWSRSSVRQSPSRYHPVIGSVEQGWRDSPKTFLGASFDKTMKDKDPRVNNTKNLPGSFIVWSNLSHSLYIKTHQSVLFELWLNFDKSFV